MKEFIKDNLNLMLIISLIFIFPFFLWSGISKIINFKKKVNELQSKIPFFPKTLANISMILVIILQILGPIILLYSAIFYENMSELLLIVVNITIIIFLIFLIVVTILYHPINKQTTTFLRNTCYFGAFILILCLFNL